MSNPKILKTFFVVLALGLAAIIYIYTASNFSQVDQRNIRLEELLALSALTFLYISILPNPLRRVLPHSPLVEALKQAQPVIVYCTLGLAVAHASIAFFSLLGGFAGLSFLSSKFLWGISLSTLAALTLLLVSIYHWLGRRLPWLTNLLYIVGVLITIHALLLGADFIILTNAIPKIFFTALTALLILESAALDAYINRRTPENKKFSPIFAVCLIIITVIGSILLSPQASTLSISEHASHTMPDGTIMPGMTMTGDASLKYNVTMSTTPAHPMPGQSATLTFKVFNSATGAPVTDYDLVMTKIMHVVITDGSLTYFDHIHPELNGAELSVSTVFPKSDVYRLYLNFQPKGGTEQQVALTLPIGSGVASSAILPAGELTKSFGNVAVTLSSADGSEFSAAKMNAGKQVVNFNFKDAATDAPITNIMPYLGAYGHLVLISEQSYEYIHVHPTSGLVGDYAGPDVQFLPYPMFGTIHPDTYRVFGQFNRDNQIFVADFTINIGL